MFRWKTLEKLRFILKPFTYAVILGLSAILQNILTFIFEHYCQVVVVLFQNSVSTIELTITCLKFIVNTRENEFNSSVFLLNACQFFSAEPEVNMASLKLGTIVLQGEMKSALLDGNSNHYDMERGYTRHSITTPDDPGILIKLGSQCIVNHIQLLLWDKDLR